MAPLDTKKQENVVRWGLSTAFLKALALALPWGVISELAGKHENLGYAFGLFVGLLCLYLVPPREKELWRLLLVGLVISLLHPLLEAVLPKAFGRH
jgi:hypothetical protein